jgi:hypothetical protein
VELTSEPFTQKHLTRIKAWLIKDIDAGREIGSVSVIEPIRVREPRVRLSDREELT